MGIRRCLLEALRISPVKYRYAKPDNHGVLTLRVVRLIPLLQFHRIGRYPMYTHSNNSARYYSNHTATQPNFCLRCESIWCKRRAGWGVELHFVCDKVCVHVGRESYIYLVLLVQEVSPGQPVDESGTTNKQGFALFCVFCRQGRKFYIYLRKKRRTCKQTFWSLYYFLWPFYWFVIWGLLLRPAAATPAMNESR